MTVFEDFVIEKVGEGRSITGLYPPTDPRRGWTSRFGARRKGAESLPEMARFLTGYIRNLANLSFAS